MGPVSSLTTVRAGLGTVYLFAPEWIPRLVGVRLDRRARVVVRILGVRHLIQAGVVSTVPLSRWPLALGSGVDALHASSMAVLAAVDRRRRRAAAADAAVAVTLAAAGWRAAQHVTGSGAR